MAEGGDVAGFKWMDEHTRLLIQWRVANEALFTGKRNAAIKGSERVGGKRKDIEELIHKMEKKEAEREMEAVEREEMQQREKMERDVQVVMLMKSRHTVAWCRHSCSQIVPHILSCVSSASQRHPKQRRACLVLKRLYRILYRLPVWRLRCRFGPCLTSVRRMQMTELQRWRYIEDLDQSDRFWWKGVLRGRTGLFPVNYTNPV
ncbi:hypothetical protein QQF64_034007 [Cirrhinus molitorella]|uniref:SH3 domain-containing protein n=1 Tax=Cirrhinus molitorella TaxID=172907 RepID=A0ABR3MVI5_9TELE